MHHEEDVADRLEGEVADEADLHGGEGQLPVVGVRRDGVVEQQQDDGVHGDDEDDFRKKEVKRVL